MLAKIVVGAVVSIVIMIIGFCISSYYIGLEEKIMGMTVVVAVMGIVCVVFGNLYPIIAGMLLILGLDLYHRFISYFYLDLAGKIIGMTIVGVVIAIICVVFTSFYPLIASGVFILATYLYRRVE